MKKILFTIIAAIAAITGAKAELTADWKTYMPFDEWPVQVIETPNRVYFLSRTFEYNKNLTGRDFNSLSLFYYDKEGDEIVSVNERANSNGNAVSCVGYNASAGYLLVAYTDCNLDFIYDNGKVYNLPAVKITSIPGKKVINSITFDPKNNMAYLATSFGYVALNDTRHEVADSRNYGENLTCAAKAGDNFLIIYDGKIYKAPADSKRFTLSDYTPMDNERELNTIVPVDNGDFYAFKSPSNQSYIYHFKKNGDGYEAVFLNEDPQFFGYQTTKEGKLLTGNVRLYSIKEDGTYTEQQRPQEDWGKPASTLNNTDLWTLTGRKGLKHYKKNGAYWQPAGDYMRPNAPATYIATSAAYHPSYGILVGSNGYDLSFRDFNQITPNQISALKGGFWKEYGPVYRNPDAFKSTYNYFGIAIDPKDPKYVYRGSVLGGLMRINMEDPSDLLIFANPKNDNAGLPGFITVADNLEAWDKICYFTTPQFSADGTMWTLYNYHDAEEAQLWYWSPADRAASNSQATYRPMKKIKVPKFRSGNQNLMTVLQKNPTMVVVGGFGDQGSFVIYDHRGTPDNTSDDRYLYYNNPYDQDGGQVSFLNINNIVEDPETGILYIVSQRGLFTVNPATAFDNPDVVNRIKVSRDDGTNLADYLLNEINVYHMSIDGEGRKWFGTSNGLVCTSADGRTIMGEFTKENSYLPDNNVYATCYNPENNSMIVCTDAGLVEMFPSGSGGSSSGGSESKMRVYPNPVEPDFYGWVRIDNIADGSLVKITDSQGGVVKEYGPVKGGSVEWDVSGANNRRVTTGVYYIMVSPGAGGGKSEISKILVLN